MKRAVYQAYGNAARWARTLKLWLEDVQPKPNGSDPLVTLAGVLAMIALAGVLQAWSEGLPSMPLQHETLAGADLAYIAGTAKRAKLRHEAPAVTRSQIVNYLSEVGQTLTSSALLTVPKSSLPPSRPESTSDSTTESHG